MLFNHELFDFGIKVLEAKSKPSNDLEVMAVEEVTADS